MAENENTPETSVENQEAVAPESNPPADAAPERRSRRERPPRAERVKPERQPRVREERPAREKPERQPRVREERPPREKPERAARVRPDRSKPERVKPSRPPFEFGLGPDLGKEYDRVMKSAFNDAAKAVEEQIEMLLQAPPETDPKLARELDRIRKAISKTIGKALATFGTRLVSPGALSFSSLTVSADGSRATAGPLSVQISPSGASRFVSQVSSLRPLLVGEEPPLKAFPNLPDKLEATFGNSLENNYFLTGTAGFAPNFEAPEDSAFSYSFDLFAKRGKAMGMRLQFSATHTLDSASLQNELKVEIPLESATAEAPAKKSVAAKPKKTD